MKKIMLVLGVACLSFAALAAVDDVLLMFSTKGPDTYSDGRDVLAGECYALCYVTDASSFKIKADGTATAGGEVLVTAPVAAPMEDGKGMHCPNLVYSVSSAKVASLKGGSYAVYLLDTRVPDASSESGYKVAGLANGKAAVVNGAGEVAAGGSIDAEGSMISSYNGSPVEGVVFVESVVDRPTITAINVDGADVVLKVSGLSPAVGYKVLTGAGPAGVSTVVNDFTRSGDTFTVSKDAGQFFKVVGTTRIVEQKQ